MSKSYVANSTINFEGYKFYVRPGDQLSYDAKHGNSLTVFRNGKFEKVIKVAPLVIEAFLKSKFLLEVKVPAGSGRLGIISAATCGAGCQGCHQKSWTPSSHWCRHRKPP